MTTKPVRVLPADVYDTLEFSALVYGGIGGGWTTDRDGTPFCAIGHADHVVPSVCEDGPVVVALFGADVDGRMNDWAVAAINARRGRPLLGRVTFEEWAKELGIVRGK